MYDKGCFLLRQMPGPPVAVCKGDQVIVEVNNKLHTEVTTQHFHGKIEIHSNQN